MTRDNMVNQVNVNMSHKKDKKNDLRKLLENKFAYGLMAFIIATSIIAIVLGTTFYLVIKNNVNGIGERYRQKLQNVPVLSWALPEAPDPDDPKYMSDKKLIERYNQIRIEKEELAREFAELSERNAQLQIYKNSEDKIREESENNKKQFEIENAQLEEKKKQIAEEKKKLDEAIAYGDKSAFKNFYESIDKENAQRIYASIITEQKISEDAKKFTQLYEVMDADAAAKIFEQMGAAKIDTVTDILKCMKKESAAEILSSMTPAFASKITEKLSKIYIYDESK